MSGEEKNKLDDRYMTNITLRNDSVGFANGTGAFYSPMDGEIRIRKADVTWKDMGVNVSSENALEDLLIIHERQHEIDIEEKGIGSEKTSLNEYYQRNYHMEVGALIAEKLEIRRQFMDAKTEEEKKEFFEKFNVDVDNRDYINALKNGEFKPDSGNSKDFIREMEFIKNSSMKYRCDPNDSSYSDGIINNTLAYLAREGENVKSNTRGFEKEVRAIYQIGGFDFSSVGNQDLYPMKNNNLEVADKLLEEGADVNKLIKFMNESNGSFKVSFKAFEKAEKLDVSGLSREQAETVLQTAIVAQENAEIIAESICLGDDYKNEFSLLGGENQTALYLDMKRDIWKKNGTLSEIGDEEKFNKLMKEAKIVELDCEAWLEGAKGILNIASDPTKAEEFEAVKRRVKENQGKSVNIDDYSTGVELPLDGVSVEDVLDNMRKKEEEDRKFWEEYYEKHPEEKEKKERLSESYQKRIMDLQSPILADELKRKIEEERRVENLRDTTKVNTYVPIGDNRMAKIDLPKFNKAELKKITNEKGESVEVAMIDGQKHGAEIVRDSDGNVVNYKLYDHGKEIDLENNEVNIVTQSENGVNYTKVELNGQLFGAEICSDANGKTKASFYEQGGILLEGADITKNYVNGEFYDSREQLKKEIKEQKGELPSNLENRNLVKVQNWRFDNYLNKRYGQEMEPSNCVELNKSNENSFSQIWRNDFQYDR